MATPITAVVGDRSSQQGHRIRARREQAMRAFNDGKRADYPLDATLDAFAEVLPQRPELLRAFL